MINNAPTLTMKKAVFIFVCIITSLYSRGQERLGISNSNYSSTNSIFLNPSSSVDSRTYMQLNLVGVNAYAMTNMGYIPDFSLWNVKRTGGVEDLKVADNKFRKFAFANFSVEGPAFVISKRNYGAGFFVRARSVVNARRLPFQVVNIIAGQDPDYSAVNTFSTNIRNAQISNMSWVEYGGNFGLMVLKKRTDMVTVGGSLRYLTGINVAYANVARLKGYVNDTILQLDDFRGTLRYNEPGWNTGRGWGLDLGVTYKKMLSNVDGYQANSEVSNCTYIDYKYKLAASLRDIGYIRFKKNTNRTGVDAAGTINTYRGDSTYADLVQYNLHTTLDNNPILATLPTVLSVQFDYNFGNHFYLNATATKNLVPNRATGVQNTNLISFCPRYEFRQFEVAMPVTLQRYIYPQLGFAFRVRTFVLGFDNLFPLIFKKKTYGVNLYFSIGISLFKNPACKTKVRNVDYCPPKIKTPKRKKSKHTKRRSKANDDVF